jgi:hypothetical protein
MTMPRRAGASGLIATFPGDSQAMPGTGPPLEDVTEGHE